MKIENILLICLITSILFEGSILLIGFIYADEVECNLLWCSFTSTSTSIHSSKTIFSECFINGIEVNCSEFPNGNYCVGNECYLDGVCPSPNNNLTIEECIELASKSLVEKEVQEE